MRLYGFATGLALASCALLAGPALSAATGDPRKNHLAPVSERLAREIAWHFGIVRIEEIVLSGALWEIAGRDDEGKELMLDISAHDGRIVN